MPEKIDLQLFSEEGAGTTDQDPGNEQVALVDGEVRLVRGGKLVSETGREDDAGEGEERESELADPDAGEDKGTPQGEQASYTPEEIRTTDFEKLDPNRLPPEMAPWYKSMQAGFTRKMQELSEVMKAVQGLPAEARAKEEAPRITAEEFYARQHTFVRGVVARDFGVDPATLPASVNNWPQTMQDAYHDKRAELRRVAEAELKRQRAEADREAAFKATANAFEAEFRSFDPEAYVDLEAKLRGGELPQKEVNTIREAIARGDKKTVADIFEKHRTAFHAGKNGIKTGEKQGNKGPAPRLENPGNGGQQEGKGQPDYAELGRLTNFEDKIAWLRKHNIKP